MKKTLEEANARIVQLETTLWKKQELLDAAHQKLDNIRKTVEDCKKEIHRKKRELEGAGRVYFELYDQYRKLKQSLESDKK